LTIRVTFVNAIVINIILKLSLLLLEIMGIIWILEVDTGRSPRIHDPSDAQDNSVPSSLPKAPHLLPTHLQSPHHLACSAGIIRLGQHPRLGQISPLSAGACSGFGVPKRIKVAATGASEDYVHQKN
jgi:hypothetical protein